MGGGIFQIITTCFLGTIITIAVSESIHMYTGVYCNRLCVNYFLINLQNSRIYQAVILFDWNLLSPKEKELYYMFLMYVQQPKILYIAGVLSLDMQTCLKVYFVISLPLVHNSKLFAEFCLFFLFLDVKIHLLVCNDFELYDISKSIGYNWN